MKWKTGKLHLNPELKVPGLHRCHFLAVLVIIMMMDNSFYAFKNCQALCFGVYSFANLILT